MGQLKVFDGTQFVEVETFPQKATKSFTTLLVDGEGGIRTTNTSFNNRSLIRKLKVTPIQSAVDSYIVQAFTSDSFDPSTLEYQATSSGTLVDNELWYHEDQDGTEELHFKVTNNSTTNSTFAVEITQEEFF